MKKNKKIIIWVSIITVILLIITITATVVINIKKEKALIKENIEIIKTNYENLSNNVEEYNKIRSEHNNKMTNFFYETYLKNKEEYEKTLNDYNNIIIKIDTSIENINKKCNQTIYEDSNIVNICSNYEVLYEKLINLYVTDIKNYNKNVAGYNEYKKDNVQLFEMIHSEYIDYNNDSKYEGIDNYEEN